ncbi:MAG: hypothetical protein HC905_04430 [Bacteroidales bacterium]|nr:hypothetical protein [Bacteroidales bacterium]
MTGQYAGMDFFIEKLEDLKNEHSFLSLYQTIFVSNIKKMLGENQLEMVDNYIENHFDLIAKASLMNPAEKSETLFYVALSRFNLKDMKGAAKVLNELIHFHDLPNRHMFRLIRLINLIVHFEMHNFVYLESGIRSLERDLKQSKRSFLTEQVILKMLRKYPLTLSKSSRKKLLELTFQELEQLKNNTYEMQLFHIFDFCKWLKEKI